MSYPINKKTMAAGAAMVALSSFVPNPLFNGGDAFAQATSTAVLTINASVTNPLGITPGPNLDFGVFATAGAGNLSVDADGADTIVSGFVITAANVGTVQLTAPKNAVFTLSVTDYKAGTIKIATAGAGGATPSKTMTVSKLFFDDQGAFFNTNITGTVKNLSQDLTGISITVTAGVGKADIGGNVIFTGDQVTGAYTGTYTMLITM